MGTTVDSTFSPVDSDVDNFGCVQLGTFWIYLVRAIHIKIKMISNTYLLNWVIQSPTTTSSIYIYKRIEKEYL